MPSAAGPAMGSATDAPAPAPAPAAALRWVDDHVPGLHRVRTANGFEYRDADGRAVRDEATLARIRRLAVPPAWESVWICADPAGHLQATGLDARGRKQYRYHADWSAQRGQTKFERLRGVAGVLPALRRRVARTLDAAVREPTREHVLATLVRLLDTTWLRVGNDRYARENGSYGLSTLRCRHARVEGDALRLSFVGKAGVRHEVRLADRRVAHVVRRCRELPGQELFRCVDADGTPHRIGSADVNAWLAEAAGTTITAKDFRTWHGSVQALALAVDAAQRGEPVSRTGVIAEVARRLGNTPAVCRKAYIHPAVLGWLERLADPAQVQALLQCRWVAKPPAKAGLSVAERRFLGLLAQRTPRAQPQRATSAKTSSQSATKRSMPKRSRARR